MPKFIKIKCTSAAGSSDTWRLLIDNEIELVKYLTQEAKKDISAWMSLHKDPDPHSGRASTIKRWIDAKSNSLKPGEVKYQYELVSAMSSLKAQGMLKLLAIVGSLIINPAGGYSDLKGFMKIWQGEIIAKVEKDDFGFPIEDEPGDTEILVLENDYSEIHPRVEKYLEDFPNKSFKVLYNLKDLDFAYVMKCILNSKIIVLYSEFMDLDQVEMFLKALHYVDHKVYMIGSSTPESLARLTEHPLFERLEKRNSIIYLN